MTAHRAVRCLGDIVTVWRIDFSMRRFAVRMVPANGRRAVGAALKVGDIGTRDGLACGR